MLTEENFESNALVFRERQAGVSLVYDDETSSYSYNAYCLEKKLLKELMSKEFSYLSDALAYINEEFGSWSLEKLGLEETEGCGSCAAKK